MSEHGYAAYTKGCRCETCRAAKADYMRTRRAAGRAQAQEFAAKYKGARLMADGARHGTRAAYDERGCRCYACTKARTDSDRKYVGGQR
jgi:hypothetical protein